MCTNVTYSEGERQQNRFLLAGWKAAERKRTAEKMMKKVKTTETWHRFRNMFIFDVVTSILHPL